MMMNNDTTLEMCINNSSYDTSVHISSILWQTIGLLGILIGIPGNIFQIIISSNKSEQKDPTSLYFMVIAICELIFLIGVFWLWGANVLLIKIDPREVMPCGIFYSIFVGSTTLSNLYLASMAIDRSLIILCPARHRSVTTRPRILLRLLLICFIVILFLIPHYFYLYYNPKTTLFLCDFHSSVNHQRLRLWSLIHAILFVAVPSLTVCISSFILLHNRCKHNRTYKQTLSESARRMHRRAIFIFFVSLGIFLSFLPGCILEVYIVYDGLFSHEKFCSARWKIYKILFNCFLTLSSINYSIKFYIRLIMSTSFRKSFIQLITCQCNQNSATLTGMNNEQCLLPVSNQNKAKVIGNDIEGR